MRDGGRAVRRRRSAVGGRVRRRPGAGDTTAVRQAVAALPEAVILGDGGPAHQEIVRLLVAAGADRSIADGQGVTALEHARRRGFAQIARLLE